MDTFVFIVLPILLGIMIAIGVLCFGVGYLVKQANRQRELRIQEARSMGPYTREVVGILSELTVGLDNGTIAIPSDFGLPHRIESAYYKAPKGLT